MKARARDEKERGLVSAKKWWGNKYGVPPKPFLDHSLPELLIEMYCDLYQQRDEILKDLETQPGDKTNLYERLAKIDEVLEDETQPKQYSPDPLIDKWERELAEGKEIDLEEQWVG